MLAIKKGELIRFDPLNEDIEVNLISDENEREKAETIGYYAMFEYVNGFRKAMYWSKEKMKAHAVKYSQGYASDLKKGTKWTFWSKDFDGMAYKTMLRQIISKWGIMSIDLQTALDSDMTVINEDGTHTYVETTPVEQSEDETYEEVVEQTAEQTVEETESVPEEKKNFVIGILKIDKIKLDYPILSEVSEDLLKIAPCRFAGPLPNSVGNLCIAGHNYLDNTFFARISSLKIGDEFTVYGLDGKALDYKIFDKKEVESTDLSCTSQETNGKKIVTLMTCNSIKQTRIIVQAEKK